MIKQAGMTIMEVLLALVIMALIMYMALHQYLTYRRGTDIILLQENVDDIFLAMGKYFRANCGNQIWSSGKLDPGVTTPSVAVTLTDLVGYLAQPIPSNPLVAKSTSAYVMQFNKMPAAAWDSRQVNIDSTHQMPVGKVVVWQAQVAVQLADSKTAGGYQLWLGGDCLSQLSGSIVTPCTGVAVPKSNYVVWSRLPSNSDPKANSSLWATMPAVKEFTQMYTTMDTVLLLTDQDPTNSQMSKQFYLCGS